MDWAQFGQIAFASVYLFCLGMLCLYGFHRYLIVFLYYRHRRKYPRPMKRFEQLPRVTIQLPMYNEQHVAARIIDHVCRIDYPRDLLDIQVLDDSTDDTPEICVKAVEEARAKGIDIHYIHRDDRVGYKAGALEAGLKVARGEFAMIFDADFVPEPSILKRTIHYFYDPKIAFVQTRWEHINRDLSLLTKSQAIFLDGHFAIEQVARNRSSRFMSFNGTAGIWRIEAIENSGGWQHDTLTEDLDLSFRVQMRGWKCAYLPNLASPAELPPGMTGFKNQQFRWTKGGAQTALKLLPKVMLSKLPLKVKIEAFFHLTCFTVYLYMAALMLLMFPAMLLRAHPLGVGDFWRATFDISVFVMATLSGTVFYMAGQVEMRRGVLNKLKYLPVLMALGIGLCASNVRAVLEALIGRKSEFVTTPKFGQVTADQQKKMVRASARKRRDWLPYVELGIAGYMLSCLIWGVIHFQSSAMALPFLLLFTFGYFWVSLTSLYEQAARSRANKRAAAPVPAAVETD